MKPIGYWMSDPQYLAQVGHLFGAYSIAFTVGVLTTPIVFGITIAVVLALAAIKEFWFDLAAWGEGDTLKDSAEDFAFYAIGCVLAVVFYSVWRWT